jgi:hypothetical protein
MELMTMSSGVLRYSTSQLRLVGLHHDSEVFVAL